MDRDLEQLIATSLSKLPPEVRKAVGKLPLTDIVQRISFKNNLHVDQSGALYTETLLAILGIEKVQNLSANLQRELGMQSAQIQSIINELNENVFKVLRTNLQNPTEPRITPSNIINPKNNPPKTEILSQIENPAPSLPMIPLKKEPEIEIKRGPAKPWESAKNEIAQNFITSKLSAPMSMPTQRTELQEKKPSAPVIQPKSSGSDPYRENLI